jgi:predicted HTH transcriptional regulator
MVAKSDRTSESMTSLQTDIQTLVDGFVAQVSDLARRAAIETLASALGSEVRPSRVSSGRGFKRRSEDLEQLSDTLLAFVAKNPGLRVEQINKQLGTSTKALQLPIRKLLASGSLKSKGKRRSTTYFAAKN